MLAHNLVGHCFMKLRHPSVTLWSYVDNIESTAPDADEAVDALPTFQQFSDLMDVAIDHNKSYAWSVNANHRKSLRSQHQVTKLSARHLGGHVQYSQVVTNSTVTDRCLEIKPLWGRLARSLSPYVQKVRAIVAKAWPSCLHGVASVHMADEHFDKLRTGAMQGLNEHATGASPPVHLSLVEQPAADPQFYALMQTVQMYREHNHTDDITAFCLKEQHYAKKTYVPRPGPMSVLLNRLHQVAWSWASGTLFLDHHANSIDLKHCPIQELRERLIEAWQARVQGIASGRKTFQGMPWVSVPLTKAGLKHLSAEDAAMLRVCLNGTFFTADRKKHQSQDHTGACKHCGMADSQVHRHWLCSAFSSCRTVQATEASHIADMMPYIAAHGWMPEPPCLQDFRKCLLSLPDETWDFLLPPRLPNEWIAFTDGACLAPTCQLGKLASWRLVVASQGCDDWLPVASGMVTGRIQTALRGELLAAIAACQLAEVTSVPLHLWTDNDLVYKRIRRFMCRTAFFKPNQKDADLWARLHNLVRKIGPLLQGVHKVCSHQDPLGAQDEFEAWVFQGNHAVDALASSVVLRFPGLLDKWKQLQQDIAHIHILRNHVHKTLIQVGRKAVQSSTTTAQDKQYTERISREEIAEADFTPPKPDEVPPKYVFTHMCSLLQWVDQLYDPAETVKCVSWFQLNLLYEHQTGHRGVRHITKRKVWVSGDNDVKHVNFVRRTNYLSDWLQGVWKHLGRPFKLLHLRPESNVVQFWTQCVSFKLKSGLLQLADELLQESQVKVTSVRALRNL